MANDPINEKYASALPKNSINTPIVKTVEELTVELKIANTDKHRLQAYNESLKHHIMDLQEQINNIKQLK